MEPVMSAVLRLPVSVAPRLQNAFEQFLAEARLRGLSHTTLTWYAVTLGPFLRHALAAGCERPEDVQLTHVRVFLADRQASVAAGRLNQYTKAIRRLFGWAVAEGYAADNPAARIRKLREARTLVSTFTEGDLHSLLDSRKGVAGDDALLPQPVEGAPVQGEEVVAATPAHGTPVGDAALLRLPQECTRVGLGQLGEAVVPETVLHPADEGMEREPMLIDREG
jgi:hypothetical protein